MIFLDILTFTFNFLISVYCIPKALCFWKLKNSLENALENQEKKFKKEIENTKKQNLKLETLLTQLLEKKAEKTIVSKSDDKEIKPIPPKKKTKIPYAMRIKVWNKYIGENIGKSKCKCCEETDITQMKFDCGHIIAESKGGKIHINNLLPICDTCNSSMGNMNMHDYKKLIKEMQE